MLDTVGRLPEAVEVIREGVEWARREGVSGMLPILSSELAGRLVRQGEWDEAAEILGEAVLAPTSWGVGIEAALTEFARLQALRGDAADAERILQKVEREQRQALGMMWTAPIAAARADAALWDGRPEAARAVVDAQLQRRQPNDETASMYLAPLIAAGARAEAELAAQARAMGDVAGETDAITRAGAVHDVGRELTAADPFPEAILYVEMAEAERDRAAGIASADVWARLVTRWEQHGNVFAAAYAGWRQAELTLAGGGARGGVPAVLARAHATAVRLGANPLRREVEDLARRARIELGAATADAGPASASPLSAQPAGSGAASVADRVGLTARELDVLRLLAGGATNREIAASLYISQKTVTVHVTRILSKLDARTRVEAAGLAQRLRLLEPDATSS